MHRGAACARDAVLLLSSYAALWAVAAGSQVGGRGGAFAALLAGEVLLVPLVVALAERGRRAGLGIAAAGLAAGGLAAAAFAAAVRLVPRLSDLASQELLTLAAPAAAAAVAALWIAETTLARGASRGLGTLAVATLGMLLPFVLDRWLAGQEDAAAALEVRTLAFRVALPLVSAGEAGFDLLRAPRVYGLYRLGEGVYHYPTARESARLTGTAALALVAVFHLFPRVARRLRRS